MPRYSDSAIFQWLEYLFYFIRHCWDFVGHFLISLDILEISLVIFMISSEILKISLVATHEDNNHIINVQVAAAVQVCGSHTWTCFQENSLAATCSSLFFELAIWWCGVAFKWNAQWFCFLSCSGRATQDHILGTDQTCSCLSCTPLMSLMHSIDEHEGLGLRLKMIGMTEQTLQMTWAKSKECLMKSQEYMTRSQKWWSHFSVHDEITKWTKI
jgi:hypothetical protein